MCVCWHCSRATGDAGSAINYYEESVEFLSKVPVKDLEVLYLPMKVLRSIGKNLHKSLYIRLFAKKIIPSECIYLNTAFFAFFLFMEVFHRYF